MDPLVLATASFGLVASSEKRRERIADGTSSKKPTRRNSIALAIFAQHVLTGPRVNGVWMTFDPTYSCLLDMSTVEDSDEYDFVNGLPEEYQCHICLCLLADPHLTTCCGHHFCKDCIFKVAKANQACPMCKMEGFMAVVDKNVYRKIRALPVRCHFHSKGCEWQGELRDLEEHLDPHRGHCKFNDVVCTKGCGKTLRRAQLETHLMMECPNRDQKCKYCDQLVPLSSMSTHHQSVCTHFPIPCPSGCSEVLRRAAVTQHLDMCPMRLINCDFAQFGCDISFQFRHKSNHMEEYSHRHLCMIAECCVSLKQDVVAKDAQIAQMSSQLLDKEKNIHRLEKTLSLQQKGFEEKLQQQQKEFHQKIDRLERMFNVHVANQSSSRNMDNILHRVKILETQVPVPPYYFTVSNFALHKQGGTQWTCPAFFSHVGGYKMAIEVSANGEGVGRDTHVSVYIRIMHGEYDDILRWPLRASVTIQLISQSGNEAHYEMTTPQYEWSRVTNGVVGVGWGWDKFIPHVNLGYDAVRRTEYLKNDRLNFRVICVDNSF